MKKIKNLKKKIFGLTLVVGLLVLSIVGTTMAYFTDVDEKTNVFISGNVDIAFDSNVFLNTDASAKVTTYPGMEIGTAATVKNTGTESAYVGIIITFNDVIAKAVTEDDLDITKLFGELANPSDKYVVNYVTGTDKTEIFVVYKDALNVGDTVEFFDDIVIPLEWDNDDMTVFNGAEGSDGLKMSIAAYATQTHGMGTDAAAALATAFDDWN